MKRAPTELGDLERQVMQLTGVEPDVPAKASEALDVATKLAADKKK